VVFIAILSVIIIVYFLCVTQWAELCNAFLVEAKWFASGHMPNSDEYLNNGLVTSGAKVVAVLILSLLGQEINSKSTEVLNSFPCIVSSVAKIQRLSDDLGSAKVYGN